MTRMTISHTVGGFILTDEKDASRYTLTRDGKLVSVLDYRDDGHTVALTRAYTVPAFRGNGYAGKVVEGPWPTSRSAATARWTPSAGTWRSGSPPTPSSPDSSAHADAPAV